MSIDSLLAYRRRERGWTWQLVAAVPEQHFAWAPAGDAFACGELVRHMMQSEVYWRRLLVAGARGERYDPFDGAMGEDGGANLAAFRPRNLAASRHARLGDSFAALLARWHEIDAETHAELAAIGDEDLRREVLHVIPRLRLAVGEMFLVMLSHEAHHRGQLSAYLKMLGVAQPPLYAQLRDDAAQVAQESCGA